MTDTQAEPTPADIAKAEMTKAVEYLVRAQTDYLAAIGGVDVSGLAVQVQLLVPQLDALVEVLANKGLISLEEYWKQCTVKMRDCEGGFRKLIREMPRIQVAPGKAPRPS